MFRFDYLIFDTETTGLPKRWDAPLNDSRQAGHAAMVRQFGKFTMPWGEVVAEVLIEFLIQYSIYGLIYLLSHLILNRYMRDFYRPGRGEFPLWNSPT